MATLAIDDLPAPAANVLRRRARAAGQPLPDYLRAELTRLARTRVPVDAIVDFLESDNPPSDSAEFDATTTALSAEYNLPPETVQVLTRRANATGIPLPDYIHRELLTLARRTSIDDVVLELREVQQQNPELQIDMEAVISAVRYARTD
ncbi:Uncharacterised protein [Nocardia otitidiscaviarum]|uniref:Uncharacterized protein n=1 Tax=Nocardia otitidiscaviarum TaxID=1823 RepID=A0A378YVM4_9NOCA|nr:hypothetical protein [Nocardia otitidiscaviarum]SUA81154.1 Uncharacterised protein [Nocardia otitidiscaviarum]